MDSPLRRESLDFTLPRVLRPFLRDPATLLGFLIVLIAVAGGLGAPLLAPHDPTDVRLEKRRLSERVVIWMHTLKNALLPVVTMLGVNLGNLLGGTVIVETIFGWPGVGKYAIDAIFLRDYPVIQGFVLYMALIFILVNLGVDVIYRWLDPRLHFGRLAV